jgi:carbohydrate diacid regulator
MAGRDEVARLTVRCDLAPKITSIDDLRLHQLIATTGRRPRARLVEALTTELRTQADWHALRVALITWCETAASLHIHRNTLALLRQRR